MENMNSGVISAGEKMLEEQKFRAEQATRLQALEEKEKNNQLEPGEKGQLDALRGIRKINKINDTLGTNL